jgi:hypothetical protein
MAQTAQAAASKFCADSAVSLAFGNNIRVEPGAGPTSSTTVSSTKASAILGGTMSKLEQMRSVQASDPSIAAAVTTHITTISSDCSRARAIFAAPGVIATAVAKDAVLGAQSVLIARRFNICAQLATKPLLTIWSRVSSKISIKCLIP